MEQSDLNAQAISAFAEILQMRIRSLDLSAAEADQAVADRCEMLALYTRPGAPEELRMLFEEAIEFTRACDQTAKGLELQKQLIEGGGARSDADLLLGARVYSDALWQHQPLSDQQIANDIARLRDRVLKVLVDNARRPVPSKDLPALVNSELAGLSDTDTVIGMNEAATLVTQSRQWKQTISILTTLAELGTLYRAIFYGGLVSRVGSQLGQRVSRERFIKDLSELPVAAIEKVPVIGHLFGIVKHVSDLILDLADKKAALQDDAEDLATRSERARAFVVLYRHCLGLWGESSVQLQKVITSLVSKMIDQMGGKLSEAEIAIIRADVLRI